MGDQKTDGGTTPPPVVAPPPFGAGRSDARNAPSSITGDDETRRLRVLFLDTMLGGTGRHSRSQGEQLVALMEAAGHEVHAASTKVSKPLRLADMLATVARIPKVDVASIAVFSGPAFWLADLTSRACARRGFPIVLVLHGGNLPRFAQRHPRRVARLLERAHLVVAPSTFNATALASLSPGPIEIIPNVVDTDASARTATPRPDRETTPSAILWMRTFQEIYAPERALEVLAELHRRGKNVHLTMAGPDKAGMGEDLRRLAASLGVDDHVTYPGFLDPAAKAAAFRSHDVFLNTSTVDNTPVTLLEAAAYRTPIVTTGPGGIPHLFGEHPGAMVCGIDDVDRLADAIESVLDATIDVTPMVDHAAAVAASMTPTQVLARWEATFAAVADATGGPPTTKSTNELRLR